jgi:hypothetical protein
MLVILELLLYHIEFLFTARDSLSPSLCESIEQGFNFRFDLLFAFHRLCDRVSSGAEGLPKLFHKFIKDEIRHVLQKRTNFGTPLLYLIEQPSRSVFF